MPPPPATKVDERKLNLSYKKSVLFILNKCSNSKTLVLIYFNPIME